MIWMLYNVVILSDLADSKYGLFTDCLLNGVRICMFHNIQKISGSAVAYEGHRILKSVLCIQW
jgi:hypothetical protein